MTRVTAVLPSLRRVGSSESSENSWPSAPDVRGAAAARSARASRSVFPSADAMSRARTEATSAGRMLPIAKSTAVSQRNSLSESRLSVMACRPSAGLAAPGRRCATRARTSRPTDAPCVSSSRTPPRAARPHGAVGEHPRGHQRAPSRSAAGRTSYLTLRATSACRAPSAPNSCSTFATAPGPEPNPVSESRQPVTSDEQSASVSAACRRARAARRRCGEGTAGAPWRMSRG